MNDALGLRNSMAEIGFELTPHSATLATEYIEKIRRSVREHPEQVLKLAHLSESERQSLRRQLAESGKEVTFEEIDDLIDLLMTAYEQEHL